MARSLATDAEAALAAAIGLPRARRSRSHILAQRARARLGAAKGAAHRRVRAAAGSGIGSRTSRAHHVCHGPGRNRGHSAHRHSGTFSRAAPMVCASPPWSCLCIWTSFRLLACAFRPLKPVFLGCVTIPSSSETRARTRAPFGGVELERTPLKALIDELFARRCSRNAATGASYPRRCAYLRILFGPNIGGSTPPPPSAP